MPHLSSSKLARILIGLLAYISLTIGLNAIVKPRQATTQFNLLAAWAATRGRSLPESAEPIASGSP